MVRHQGHQGQPVQPGLGSHALNLSGGCSPSRQAWEKFDYTCVPTRADMLRQPSSTAVGLGRADVETASGQPDEANEKPDHRDLGRMAVRRVGDADKTGD
jgi:hypothetical protein